MQNSKFKYLSKIVSEVQRQRGVSVRFLKRFSVQRPDDQLQTCDGPAGLPFASPGERDLTLREALRPSPHSACPLRKHYCVHFHQWPCNQISAEGFGGDISQLLPCRCGEPCSQNMYMACSSHIPPWPCIVRASPLSRGLFRTQPHPVPCLLQL